MRHHVASLALILLFASGAQAQTFDHSDLDLVLRNYVTSSGVLYKDLQKNRAPLDRYVTALGTVQQDSFEKWPRPDHLAYLLNAYNAIVLQQVVDRYPIPTLSNVPGFYDSIRHQRYRLSYLKLTGS